MRSVRVKTLKLNKTVLNKGKHDKCQQEVYVHTISKAHMNTTSMMQFGN